MAFRESVAPYPVHASIAPLQRYVKVASTTLSRAHRLLREFRSNAGGAILAVHIRRGLEFSEACKDAVVQIVGLMPYLFTALYLPHRALFYSVQGQAHLHA